MDLAEDGKTIKFSQIGEELAGEACCWIAIQYVGAANYNIVVPNWALSSEKYLKCMRI